jgi:hypothetical protein
MLFLFDAFAFNNLLHSPLKNKNGEENYSRYLMVNASFPLDRQLKKGLELENKNANVEKRFSSLNTAPTAITAFCGSSLYEHS